MCPASTPGSEGNFSLNLIDRRLNSRLDDSKLISNHTSALIKSLLALSTALQELGSGLGSPRRDRTAKETLYRFIEALADGDSGLHSTTGHRWNLRFLQKLYDAWDPHWVGKDGDLEGIMRDMVRQNTHLSDAVN